MNCCTIQRVATDLQQIVNYNSVVFNSLDSGCIVSEECVVSSFSYVCVVLKQRVAYCADALSHLKSLGMCFNVFTHHHCLHNILL